MAVNGSNGHVAGGFARMQKLAEKLEADAAAIRRTMAVMGISALESSQARAETTLAGALKIEKVRKKGRPWATPEEKARRYDLIRAFLARSPLSKIRPIHEYLSANGVDVSVDRTRQLLVELGPEIQRVGERFDTTYRLRQVANTSSKPAPKAKAKTGRVISASAAIRAQLKKLPMRKRGTGSKSHSSRRPSAAFDGTTREKARAVVQLVRDTEGGIIALKDLVPKAREAGIGSLTGMVNYTRAGWLKRTRDRKGRNAYRFVRMPPETEIPVESAALEG